MCIECGLGMRRHWQAVGRAGCSVCKQFRQARTPPGTWLDPVVLTTDDLISVMASPSGPPVQLAPHDIVQHAPETPEAGLELLHDAFWRPERVYCTRDDDPHHAVIRNVSMLVPMVYEWQLMDEPLWLMAYWAWLNFCWNAVDNRRPCRWENFQPIKNEHD